MNAGPTEGLGEGGYCTGCGQRVDRCGGRCGRAGGEPRFCPACGRRLATVVVTPGIVEARCRDHGVPA